MVFPTLTLTPPYTHIWYGTSSSSSETFTIMPENIAVGDEDINNPIHLDENEVASVKESILDASTLDSSNLYGEVFDLDYLAAMSPLSAASAVSTY